MSSPDTAEKHPLAKIRTARLAGDVASLIRSLASGDTSVRQAAARSLGDLRAREAVRPITLLLGSPDLGTRVLALKALGKIGDPAAAPALFDAAQRDNPIGVRTTALTALARVGDKRAGRLIASILVDRSLEDQVQRSPMRPRGSARQVRRWARRMLVELQASDALDVLVAAEAPSRPLDRLHLRRLVAKLRKIEGSSITAGSGREA